MPIKWSQQYLIYHYWRQGHPTDLLYRPFNVNSCFLLKIGQRSDKMNLFLFFWSFRYKVIHFILSLISNYNTSKGQNGFFFLFNLSGLFLPYFLVKWSQASEINFRYCFLYFIWYCVIVSGHPCNLFTFFLDEEFIFHSLKHLNHYGKASKL